jgi:hypothetical protein
VRGAGAGNLLTELAVLLMRAEATAPSLDRLLPGTADLTGEPERWRALVLAGHPEALRSVVAVLQQTGVSPALLARALRCWRQAVALDLDADAAAMLPPALRALFGE